MFMSKPTLDSILSGFEKTIADLDALVARNDAQDKADEAKITELERVIADRRAESRRAYAVSEKLRALIAE